MNKDFYNELQFSYVSLTKRFAKYSDYSFDCFYKCYNDQYSRSPKSPTSEY